MNSMRYSYYLLLAMLLTITACEHEYTPKQRGYYRISLPERKEPQHYQNADCPFTFEYPSYAKLYKDTVFLDTVPDNPCWMNLELGELNGTIFLSYKTMNGKQDLGRLIEDAHTLSYKHTIKAEYINPISIHPKPDVYGLYYDVGGNAASNVQFFVTDSNRHFIRGALYFRNTPNIDSIAPALNYVKQDLTHLISTLSWKQ
ncbi:MAG: gliding motility lipoprotein GldD [Bacteroidota bacterium]|jgi:gliding motility-associated lipoprotein GldD